MAIPRWFLAIAALAACSGAQHPVDPCHASIDARTRGEYDNASDAARAQALAATGPTCQSDCYGYDRDKASACMEEWFLKADNGDTDAQRVVYYECDEGGSANTPGCAWLNAHANRYPAGVALWAQQKAGTAEMNRQLDYDRSHPVTTTNPNNTETTSPPVEDTTFAVVDQFAKVSLDDQASKGWTLQYSTKLLIGGDQPLVAGPIHVNTGVTVFISGLTDATCRDVSLEIQGEGKDDRVAAQVADQVLFAAKAYNVGGNVAQDITATLTAGGAATCPAVLMIWTKPSE